MNANAAPPTDPNPVATAVNAVANAASAPVAAAVNAVSNAASSAVNAVSGAVNAATNMFSNVGSPKTFNSLIPLGNSPAPPANNKKNASAPPANNKKNASAAPVNTSPRFTNSAVGVNASPPTFGNFSVSKMTNSPWALPLGIFVSLIIVFLIGFSYFNKQIMQGYEYAKAAFQQAIGVPSQPTVMAPTIPVQGTVKEITVPPIPPQAETPAVHAAAHPSFVEKILPSGGANEVYNVAQNKFTYYDAEPLCKALGAELATYEQVKDAWGKGADWCNYGWVKGQMAVYPTQKETYDKLQAGPEDQRMACGTTGINGGHFDNPDMLYGVNCYGKKPSQSAHDEDKLMDEGKVPRTPETLKIDQKVNEFKSEADSLFVKPFSDAKWSTK